MYLNGCFIFWYSFNLIIKEVCVTYSTVQECYGNSYVNAEIFNLLSFSNLNVCIY